MQLLIQEASVVFEGKEDTGLAALGPVTCAIEDESFVALLGPSGSGKTTLIRAIAGLQALNAGRILADGHTITEPTPEIALMFQDPNLMPWRTVRDNIGLPLELAGVGRQERIEQVTAMLPALGLEDFGDSYPAELSGGMAQRVALGRVLVQHPQVLLLDEPFGALDAMTRERISLDLLKLWAAEKPTVMMVTHDINEAVLLADRILVLSQRPGRIIADFEVPLERPRHLEMMYTEPFLRTARDVREAINQAGMMNPAE
jgi:NitT/TauT family transport system ATP-binding protein